MGEGAAGARGTGCGGGRAGGVVIIVMRALRRSLAPTACRQGPLPGVIGGLRGPLPARCAKRREDSQVEENQQDHRSMVQPRSEEAGQCSLCVAGRAPARSSMLVLVVARVRARWYGFAPRL